MEIHNARMTILENCDHCGGGIYSKIPFIIVTSEPVLSGKKLELRMEKYKLCKECFERVERDVRKKIRTV